MLRSPLRPLLRPLLRSPTGLGSTTLTQKAIGILRSYGADAHVYLPGVGTVSGITAGNYLDSAGVTAATVDNPVGLVVDPIGAVNATQATTANKPILRRGLLNQLLWSQDFTNAAWGSFGNTTVSKNRLTYPTGLVANPIRQVLAIGASPCTIALDIQSISGIATGTIDFSNIESSSFSASTTRGIVVCNITPAAARSWLDIQLDGAGVIDIFSIGLFQGTYTAQQIIDAGGIPLTTTAPASSTTGKYWWQFDGSNDSLLTGNLGITNTVSVVIAGVLNSLPTTTVFANEGVNGLQILIRNTGVIDCFKAGVEPIISAASGTIVAGVPFVLTFRLQGGVSVLRKNGAQVSTAAYVASLSATAGLSIGEASESINGSIYIVDVITATTTDSDLLTLERLAGQMAGVSI